MKWLRDNEMALCYIAGSHAGVDRDTLFSGILRLFSRYVATDVSTECNALIFTVEESKKTEVLDPKD